jgi:hypothetical protein
MAHSCSLRLKQAPIQITISNESDVFETCRPPHPLQLDGRNLEQQRSATAPHSARRARKRKIKFRLRSCGSGAIESFGFNLKGWRVYLVTMVVSKNYSLAVLVSTS